MAGVIVMRAAAGSFPASAKAGEGGRCEGAARQPAPACCLLSIAGAADAASKVIRARGAG